jgi:hypothetical protein
MDHVSFAALTRRASLTALSAIGLAAMASPPTVNAKKKHKKKKKFDVNTFCKQQVSECETAIADDCDNDPECIAEAVPCCQFLATCDFAGFVVCAEPPEN